MTNIEVLFDTEVKEVSETFGLKGTRYGNKWLWEDFAGGLKMRYCDILRKFLRLNNIVWDKQSTDAEIVIGYHEELLNDTLDLAVYALMMRVMVKKLMEGAKKNA